LLNAATKQKHPFLLQRSARHGILERTMCCACAHTHTVKTHAACPADKTFWKEGTCTSVPLDKCESHYTTVTGGEDMVVCGLVDNHNCLGKGPFCKASVAAAPEMAYVLTRNGITTCTFDGACTDNAISGFNSPMSVDIYSDGALLITQGDGLYKCPVGAKTKADCTHFGITTQGWSYMSSAFSLDKSSIIINTYAHGLKKCDVDGNSCSEPWTWPSAGKPKPIRYIAVDPKNGDVIVSADLHATYKYPLRCPAAGGACMQDTEVMRESNRCVSMTPSGDYLLSLYPSYDTEQCSPGGPNGKCKLVIDRSQWAEFAGAGNKPFFAIQLPTMEYMLIFWDEGGTIKCSASGTACTKVSEQLGRHILLGPKWA